MESNVLVPYDHVVFTDFEEGEGVLVDLNTKRYYQLNETGIIVWRCLERGRTTGEMVEEIVGAYDVTPEHAAASVEKLLGILQARKLVRARDNAG